MPRIPTENSSLAGPAPLKGSRPSCRSGNSLSCDVIFDKATGNGYSDVPITMKITSRFTIAIHTLLCIEAFSPEFKLTSEFIAASVNVNPVIIRRTLGQLKEAGLVVVARGSGGALLARDAGGITLLDVYNAVESVDGDLFNFHEHPNQACPVGKHVHAVLDGHLHAAQKALEDYLGRVRLSDLSSQITDMIDQMSR